MLLNLYYIIWKGSSEIVTNGWKEKCVKESEFLAPLCLPGFLGLLLTIFTIFLFCFFVFKCILFQNTEVATKDSPIILGLDELFIDTGEWQQYRKENLATSPFFDQCEHANFLGNQESVTLPVMFLFTPSRTGRFAAVREQFPCRKPAWTIMPYFISLWCKEKNK